MNLEQEPFDDRPVRWLRRAVWLLLLLGFGACLSEGANQPADPTVVGGSAASRVEGFGEIAFRVQPTKGLPSTTEFCALLADTPEQRERGLMNRTDMAGYDGMVFRFDSDSTVGFHMKNTPMPLTVAWFGSDGRFLSATDMAPCAEAICPTYPAPGPYRFALEVPQGNLPTMGITEGTRIDVGGPCAGAGE